MRPSGPTPENGRALRLHPARGVAREADHHPAPCLPPLPAPAPPGAARPWLAYDVSSRIHSFYVIEVRRTDAYTRWFSRLRDRKARARINIRVRRLSLGNFGDVRPVGRGVSEIRIDYGPGYRVYFIQRGSCLVVLLAGGDKSSQRRDIARARELALEL